MTRIYRDHYIEHAPSGMIPACFSYRYWHTDRGYDIGLATPRAGSEEECKKLIDKWHDEQERN